MITDLIILLNLDFLINYSIIVTCMVKFFKYLDFIAYRACVAFYMDIFSQESKEKKYLDSISKHVQMSSLFN